MSHQNEKYERIAVLGAGAWGSALAQVCAQSATEVKIWAFEKEVVESINSQNENIAFLAGVKLAPNISATSNLEELKNAQAILAVVPAQFMRRTLRNLAPYISAETPIVLCSKGIEQQSLNLMSEVLAEEIPQAMIAVLSGPSFAKDVARLKPTAVTLAVENQEIGKKLLNSISNLAFRPYLAGDIIGAEIGGAVKNVLAIACGMSDGAGLGESARAALITRGFAELLRLAKKMGAKSDTLMGLCGLGDLVLTCSSTASRNFSLGYALGQGKSVKEALEGKNSVAEGLASAPALKALAAKHGVEMPICEAVYQITEGNIDIKSAISTLLSRPLRSEGE